MQAQSTASSPPQTAYVVLWRGEYKNDGLERMRWINSALAPKDCYVRGEPRNWELVAAFPQIDPKAA